MAEQTQADQDALALVMRLWRKANKSHESRQQCYIDRYKAFKGVLNVAEDTWQSNLSPPYIFQIIETIYSMIASEHPRDNVIPNGANDVAGATALNKLLPIQRRADNFDEKYAQWVKQALVLGVSPAKIDWESRMRSMKRRIYNEQTGEMQEVDHTEREFDQPTFINMDASDFFWDPSASRMDQADFAIARWWVTLESLKADPNLHNIDKLKDAPRGYGGASPMKDEAIKRDKSNLIEVLEYWDPKRLIQVANRSVVIRNDDHPLWHGKLPFVVATPVPDLYSMEGISEVELIMDIQAAIWSFLNQRLDNTRLISNAIVMIRDTMDDPDKIVFEPGAIWPVSDPQEVALWTPNQNITQSSLEAEAELKSDLLNLTAAVQYLGGSAPDQMQNNTATGINIMSNNAMNRVLTKRQRIFDSLKAKGFMEIALNQQLWHGPLDVRIPGATEEEPFSFERYSTQDILCNCSYDIEMATESMNRQERRNEALQLFQVLMPALQVYAQMGVPFNPTPLLEKLLDAFDVKDIDRWLTMTTPNAQGDPNVAGAQGPGGGNPEGPPPGLMSLIPGLAQQLQGVGA